MHWLGAHKFGNIIFLIPTFTPINSKSELIFSCNSKLNIHSLLGEKMEKIKLILQFESKAVLVNGWMKFYSYILLKKNRSYIPSVKRVNKKNGPTK